MTHVPDKDKECLGVSDGRQEAGNVEGWLRHRQQIQRDQAADGCIWQHLQSHQAQPLFSFKYSQNTVMCTYQVFCKQGLCNVSVHLCGCSR